MFTKLLHFFVCTTVCTGVLSVTFQNVKVQYRTEYEEVIVDVNSSNSLKEDLPAEEITGIAIVDDSLIPTIYEDAFADLPNLTILRLQKNGIEEIEPGAFRNVPLLEILRLTGNKLKKIKEGVFSNLNLVFLNLDYNRIEEISSQAFDNLPKLEALDLSNNKLKNFLPEWLMGKPKLASVSFRYNEIEELPSGALQNYHKDIDFNNNKIVNISSGIFGSDKTVLGHLWLGDNYIVKWEEDFLQNVQIRGLDLSRNQLKCLNGTLANFFVAFQTRIDGNPWDCGCLLELAKWVSKQKGHKVYMRSSVRNCNSTCDFSGLF